MFLESLHNIKSQPECSNKIKGRASAVDCCVVSNTKSRAGKTFQGVTSTSDIPTEISVSPSQDAEVEENHGQDCLANSLETRSWFGSSRTHLCLQCFPDVEDKDEFTLFVEELFKDAMNSKKHQ